MSATAPIGVTLDQARIGRAMVVGTGLSGRAATRLLTNDGIDVVIVEPAGNAASEPESRWAHTSIDGDTAHAALDTVDVVIPSPGIPPLAPIIAAALDRRIAVWSEPELAMRLRPRRLLAVTGTNGKTSTTELVAEMLQMSGTSAQACGNIGVPLCDAVLDTAPDMQLVAELSSFQLHHCHQLRPDVAAVLNIAHDHLDWHGTMEAYAADKGRIWQAQSADDWAVANSDDPATCMMQEASAASRRASFSARVPVVHGVGVDDEQLVRYAERAPQPLVALTELTSSAPHHVANIAAAATMAHLAGASDDAIVAVARRYVPGAHRGELVATIDGIRYVNDSKATNPHAAAAALASAGPTVWIAGGVAKGVDLSALSTALKDVRHAALIGEAAATLADVCDRADVPATRCATLDEAVATAAMHAQIGDTVLLAPACASFDQFRDYKARGTSFIRAVRAHADTAGEVVLP